VASQGARPGFAVGDASDQEGQAGEAQDRSQQDSYLGWDIDLEDTED
jgi:hypothetical protein